MGVEIDQNEREPFCARSCGEREGEGVPTRKLAPESTTRPLTLLSPTSRGREGQFLPVEASDRSRAPKRIALSRTAGEGARCGEAGEAQAALRLQDRHSQAFPIGETILVLKPRHALALA